MKHFVMDLYLLGICLFVILRTRACAFRRMVRANRYDRMFETPGNLFISELNLVQRTIVLLVKTC